METPTNQEKELARSPDSFTEMVENSNIPESSARMGDSNLEPYVGMEFESIQAARNFYNDYARSVGFSVRSNTSYRSKKDMTIISKQFVCSKEGFRRKSGSDEGDHRSIQTRREGCKAEIVIRKRESGKWYVARFEKNHNHALASPNKVHFLRSHRRVFDPKRRLIDVFREVGMSVGGVMDVPRDGSRDGAVDASIDESGEISDIGFAKKDYVDYIGEEQLGIHGTDAQIVLDHFKCLRANDPSFFYAVQLDQDQHLRNVFWVDMRSRLAYGHFGDVVRLDMVHKMNQYLTSFALFTGVNHHQQSILFGYALLSDESESTFVWLFKTWIEAMPRRHPISIITDQDKATKTAVAKVFPETRHHFCRWNILKKAQEKLGFVYQIHQNFGWEFAECINKSETASGFESAWGALLDKYNLRENEWLQSIYSDREQWVLVYIRATFSAGIVSTRRSESINSLLDGYVNEHTTLQDFIMHCEKALDDQCQKEIQADFFTSDNEPILKTPLPVEKEAANIYTKKMFEIFQEEIVESLLCAVNDSGENGVNKTYQVAKFDQHKPYVVTFNGSDMTASCSCKMFEFEGILCRHILAVFKVKNVFTLPSHYVLNRWTRNAKKGFILDVRGIEMQGNSTESTTVRYNNLCQVAIKCAEKGATSLDVYKVALSALLEAKEKIDAAKRKYHDGHTD